jgi:hypothetical protein
MADPGWGEEGTTTIRAGLALGAAAGVLAAIAPRWDLVEGPSRDAPGVTKVIEPDRFVGGFGVLIVILLVAAVFVPRLWLWLAGLGVTTGLAGACGLVVSSGRTSSDLAADADVSLLAGGRLLTMAFWVAMVAVAVMLVGFRKMALAPRPAEEGVVADAEDEEDAPAPTPSGRARRKPGSGKASLAFALGIGGFMIVIGSSLAVALGTLSLGDIRASGGVLPGRGLAIAAVVLGLVALSLLVALVGVGTLAATPSS